MKMMEERHGCAKLTLKDVQNIRSQKTLGTNRKVLVAAFNVHVSTIDRIVCNRICNPEFGLTKEMVL
jgi:hypothetical protein